MSSKEYEKRRRSREDDGSSNSRRKHSRNDDYYSDEPNKKFRRYSHHEDDDGRGKRRKEDDYRSRKYSTDSRRKHSEHDDDYYSRKRSREEDEYESGYWRRKHSNGGEKSRKSKDNDDSSSDDDFFDDLRKGLKSSIIPLIREVPPDFDTTEMMSVNTLPCFDRLRDFKPKEIFHKFLDDAEIGDEVACKVTKLEETQLELKPECTMSRYRRCLYRIPFPKDSIVPICEMELLACAEGDIISATITEIDLINEKIVLTINNYGIPLKAEQLPAYYRRLPEITIDEPNLENIIGLAPLCTKFSLLPELLKKDLDNPRKRPEALQQKLLEVEATKLVEKAAENVKNGKNFDGIEIFTKSLKIVPNFIAALIGRSAAYANEKMFIEALNDLKIVREIDPDDEIAKNYTTTILIVYGQELEEKKEYEKAVEKYKEAIEVSDDDRARILLSDVQKKIEDQQKHEQFFDVEKEKQKQKEEKKQRKENSKKLKEMEKFIESLKKK